MPSPENPQNWNRFSYVRNNPLIFSDPSGHAICKDAECEELVHPVTGNIISRTENGGNNETNSTAFLEIMEEGDIISIMLDGTSTGDVLNLMLGQLEDGSLGFWDVDAHTYVTYDSVATLVNLAESWAVFFRTDNDYFDSFTPTAHSKGDKLPVPLLDFWWAGGVDNDPSYVEVFTEVDWFNMPGQALNAVLGPTFVSLLWVDTRPTEVPSPAGWFPLTAYISSLEYFANEEYVKRRIPIIHP